MGANAQTSVPTFTAGEILTAANMNISARTGIPVFADTTARDAAFGGTGEKTLAEGQFCFLEDSNSTLFYDGASWQAVASASGLTLISATTIGSAVSTVTVSNAFSATYDNYKIMITGGAGSTASRFQMILGATTTNYAITILYNSYNNTASGLGGSAQSAWFNIGSISTDTLQLNIDLQNPYLTENTFLGGWYAEGPATGFINGAGIVSGILNNTTSYTDFTVSPGSGTITGGTIRVYGYQNS